MKKFLILVLCFSSLVGNDATLADKAKNALNFLLDKSNEYGSIAVEKSKEYGTGAWDKTKQAGTKSKEFTLSKTVLYSLNSSFEKEYIHFQSFDINGTQTKIVVNLKGEEAPLTVSIDDFHWSVTKDDKYIIISELKTNANIPWIHHSIEQIKHLFGGSFVVKNSFLGRLFLSSMKSANPSIDIDVDSKYKNWLIEHPLIQEKLFKDMTALDALHIAFSRLLDKKFIDVQSINLADKTATLQISFDGQKPIPLTISNYTIDTANKKSLIVFQDIRLNTKEKPWIESLMRHEDNKISLPYDELLEFIGNELYK